LALKLAACGPWAAVCCAVRGHVGGWACGRPCPLACAAACAVRSVPGPACAHGRSGALVCRSAAWAIPAASGHSHTPGGPRPARRPSPCRLATACLMSCPFPRPVARPAVNPAGPPATWPQPRRRGFMRPVWCPGSLSYMPPYSPPNTAFCTENHPEICAKKLPHVPPLGGLGNDFRPIDAAKNGRYHPGQAKAARPTPSEPPQAGTAPATRKGR